MSEEYGNDIITIVDADGEEIELEHLETAEINGERYMAFLPTDIDEDDDDYGIVILKASIEDGEEYLNSIDDDDELNEVFEFFITLFSEEDDEDEEDQEDQEAEVNL